MLNRTKYNDRWEYLTGIATRVCIQQYWEGPILEEVDDPEKLGRLQAIFDVQFVYMKFGDDERYFWITVPYLVHALEYYINRFVESELSLS